MSARLPTGSQYRVRDRFPIRSSTMVLNWLRRAAPRMAHAGRGDTVQVGGPREAASKMMRRIAAACGTRAAAHLWHIVDKFVQLPATWPRVRFRLDPGRETQGC